MAMTREITPEILISRLRTLWYNVETWFSTG